MTNAKHPAAFINELAETGTKAEVIQKLQELWDHLQDVEIKLAAEQDKVFGWQKEARVLIARASKAEQPIKRLREGLEDMVNAEYCPNCNDIGYTIWADSRGRPQQEQCQFCYEHASSVFNAKSSARQLLQETGDSSDSR